MGNSISVFFRGLRFFFYPSLLQRAIISLNVPVDAREPFIDEIGRIQLLNTGALLCCSLSLMSWHYNKEKPFGSFPSILIGGLTLTGGFILGFSYGQYTNLVSDILTYDNRVEPIQVLIDTPTDAQNDDSRRFVNLEHHQQE
jgi:hypothetical protein